MPRMISRVAPDPGEPAYLEIGSRGGPGRHEQEKGQYDHDKNIHPRDSSEANPTPV
jgi:hypothetical protein